MATPRALTKNQSLSERAEHLRSISLFADVIDQAEILEQLAETLHEVVFETGDPILTEGEPGSDFFMLTSGKAGVFRKTAEGDVYKVASLDGDMHAFFGEGALLDSERRSATIKAETRCHCLVLDRTTFERFTHKHPHWALPVLTRIARAVLARLRKSNDDLMLLYKALIAEIRGS